MTEMDGSSTRPPQISEMWQKFALAFKTKTFELFADDEEPSDADGFSLLDSAEDFIPDQKVVVIKPDQPPRSIGSLSESSNSDLKPSIVDTLVVKQEQAHKLLQESSPTKSLRLTRKKPIDTQMAHTLISSIFASVSSFEASYLQLQTAHVPFVEESIKAADRTLVSHLQRLSDFKRFYRDLRTLDYDPDLPIGSFLEAQVQENQSKLRILGTVSDQLQTEIDKKDAEVLALRRKLGELQNSNLKLSKKLSNNLSSSSGVILSTRVFDSVLHDVCRATHKFSKNLIYLMRKAGWDLDMAANTVYPGIDFVKKQHNQYAFLSYICLGMFQGFDSEGFGLGKSTTECNGHILNSGETNSSLKQLLEHVSSNPMDLLSMNSNCEFALYCERKYQELIHPTMESSIFCKLDRNEAVLKSWRSLSTFYEAFVHMASSMWTLHKLAFSFDPVIEIFQVERGVEFSMVYMEDVTRRYTSSCKSRAKVGFTVVPGFKIRGTVIQSQVYLSGLKWTD